MIKIDLPALATHTFYDYQEAFLTQAFEPFLDSLYPNFALFIGIRMLLIKDKSNPLLGFVTLLLGLEDSFHLIPRTTSHAMLDGSDLNQGALFFGIRISALITFAFYLLLYIYIRREGDHIKKDRRSLNTLVYGCFLVRVVTVFLSFKRFQTMDLILNIPLVLMGLVDFTLLWKEKGRSSFSRLVIYVFFSLLFYILVVLFKNTYPPIGMLMMPKTIMHVLVVIKLYRNIKKGFVEKDVAGFAAAYSFSGTFAGALYRELGKIYPLSLYLARLHTHLIVLGFLVLLIFYPLLRDKGLDKGSLGKLVRIFNFGIYLSFSSFFLHGLVDLYNPAPLVKACLAVTSGLGYILLTLGAALLSLEALRALEERERPA